MPAPDYDSLRTDHVNVADPADPAAEPVDADDINALAEAAKDLNTRQLSVESALANPAAAATRYVSAIGDDDNDGLTWGTAKATIQAAVDVLPTQTSDAPGEVELHFGAVEIGYGTFEVTSYSRVDTGCDFTNGSPVVLDPHITADDLGSLVGPAPGQAFWGTRGARIIAVTPGVSYTMDLPATATHTNQWTRIHRPAVFVPPGVTLRGRTRATGTGWGASEGFTHSGTTIVDNGTGITIWLDGSTAYDEASGFDIERLRVEGNDNNIYGLYGVSTNDVRINGCCFHGHGEFGIFCGGQWYSAYWNLTDVVCQFNGTAAATGVTGGISFLAAGWTNVATNCHFVHNYGFNVYLGNAIGNTFVNCDLNFALHSAADYGGSGIYSSNSYLNRFEGCWIGDYALYGVVFKNTEAPTPGIGLDLEDCTITPEAVGGQYGIFTVGGTQAVCRLRGVTFGDHPTNWAINNAADQIIKWDDCKVQGGNGFIEQEPTLTIEQYTDGIVPVELDRLAVLEEAVAALSGGSGRGAWTPNVNGLKAANFDPIVANAQTGCVAGFVFMCRLWLPDPTVHSNIHFYVYTAGTSLTSNQCIVGVYSPGGALLGKSGDLSVVVASTGPKTVGISPEAGQSLPTGGPDVYVRVALLMNASGGVPQLLQYNETISEPANANTSGTGLRFGRNGGGSTALPATDAAATTESQQQFWVGMS